MENDRVTVDQVQYPVYVRGERFPTRNNVGLALEDLENSGLVALTGSTGAKARIVAPLKDKIWKWFNALAGIYNVTDHQGRFGRKGANVNVVAHGLGHLLSTSQKVKEIVGTDYTRKIGTAHLSEGEEIALLAEEGTPIFAYEQFLEASQDPLFWDKNKSVRVVRTQDVLAGTKHGMQALSDLYDNSSVLCYVGGRTPVKVITTPEGEEKTVTIAQALVDRTGQRFNRNNLGVRIHDREGGRVLFFGGGSCYGYLNDYDLDDDACFVGMSAGGAKEDVPRKCSALKKQDLENRIE